MPLSAEPTWPRRLEQVPMPLEEYLALTDRPKVEYVRGKAIVSPPATRGHNKVQRRLAQLLEDSLEQSLDVATDAGWHFEGRYRIPDVAVFTATDPASVFADDIPILVAEVLSPSTASEDTVRKSTEYLRAGIPRYWIVDREQRALVAFEAADDRWELALRLDEAEPRGNLSVGEHDEVPLDLDVLLRP